MPWLYRTAWNVIANHWRAEEGRARLVGVVAAEAPDPSVDVVERAVLLAALAELSDADREALMLSAWEGLDARRAAEVVGCSAATFSVRLHRARRRLEQAAARAGEEVVP